ncbi:FAD-dependent monooxygenase [Niallia nealsonii]|uniref:FAD-binding protein n=1 Tax=Niallia nealsonii TaxID=115979 RepID=A0A2N0YX50_9BACI|nr:FAD-dependent monooxygenase [Niallia nealsonii]PKG21837.1 FAD-binding protein [Niallia nealsonii]
MGNLTVLEADVCVVGAGPGGALLSYLLEKANVSTILLERHQDINKEFRGEHLNEEGMAVLKKAGLFVPLEKMGILPMKRVEYVDRGKVFKTILPAKGINHTGIHVPQNHLLKVILNKTNTFPDFQLKMNAKVVDLVADEKGGYSGVMAIIDNKKTLVRSKLIIAADGRFSTIRKKAEFPITPIRHGYDLLWAKIPAPPNWEPTVRMALANDSQLALFTQYGGYIQIGWNIKEGSFPALRKGSCHTFVNSLVEAFPELEKNVSEHIQSWQDFVLLKVESSKSSTWIKQNVVLLGDAAHTMSPTGAFGLNSSLKDAEVLAGVIAAVLLDKKPFSHLKEYENVRKISVEEIQLEQLKRESSFKNHFTIKADY